MTIVFRFLIKVLPCLIAFLIFPSNVATSQVTRAQLAAMVPGAAETSRLVRPSISAKPILFGRTMPKGELNEPHTGHPIDDHIVDDEFEFNAACTKPGYIGRVSHSISRALFSNDRRFHLGLKLIVADSPEMAGAVMGSHSGGSLRETLGTFSSQKMLGDYSWTLGGDENGALFTARCGNVIVGLKVFQTKVAQGQSILTLFPPCALDALACRVFLAASRIPAITGVESKKWNLEINGKTVTKVSAVEVANRTFVSPLALCKAAGITAVWNTDMSTVDIKRGELVRLFPGSVETILGKGPGKKLKLPPFMDGDKCMMDLDDLLMVLGGSRVTEGDKIAIRL